MVPLLIGLGSLTGIGAGVTGLGTSLHQYRKLLIQIIDDLKHISGTILDLQAQLNSRAEVTLQNRRGLDLLIAKKGRLCLFLNKECCFYAK